MRIWVTGIGVVSPLAKGAARTMDRILAGDRAISLWTVRGKGGDGEDLDYQGCDIYRFQGDKIIHKNTFWKIIEHKDRL